MRLPGITQPSLAASLYCFRLIIGLVFILTLLYFHPIHLHPTNHHSATVRPRREKGQEEQEGRQGTVSEGRQRRRRRGRDGRHEPAR